MGNESRANRGICLQNYNSEACYSIYSEFFSQDVEVPEWVEGYGEDIVKNCGCYQEADDLERENTFEDRNRFSLPEDPLRLEVIRNDKNYITFAWEPGDDMTESFVVAWNIVQTDSELYDLFAPLPLCKDFKAINIGYTDTFTLVNRSKAKKAPDTKYVPIEFRPDKKVFFRVCASNDSGESEGITAYAPIVVVSKINAYPNPFSYSQGIKVEYTTASGEAADVSVYNLRGELVRTLYSGHQPAGKNFHLWRGDDDAGNRVASGIYIIRVMTSSFQESKKVRLIR